MADGPDFGAQMAAWNAMRSMQAGPTQGAICGGRPLGGFLGDINMPPLFNLQANGLLSGKICSFGRPSAAANGSMQNAIASIGDAFLKSIANTGIQPAPIQEARIETPNFGGGSSFADLTGARRGSGWSQEA